MPTLYHAVRSTCSWRVRLALKLKNIEHESVTIDLANGETKSEAYRAVNCFGLVPFFEDDDGTKLSESFSIIQYLEEEFPDSLSLLPKSKSGKATCRRIFNRVQSGIQPYHNSTFRKQLDAVHPGFDFPTFIHNNIVASFTELEGLLETTAGTYAVGDSITLADLALSPQAWAAEDRFNVDLSQFPVLHRVYKAAMSNEAFQETHPDTLGKKV